MTSMPTSRQMAVISIRAAKRLQEKCLREAGRWEEVDEYVRAEFEILSDRIDVLVKDMEEIYPGRSKKGGAA